MSVAMELMGSPDLRGLYSPAKEKEKEKHYYGKSLYLDIDASSFETVGRDAPTWKAANADESYGATTVVL